MKKVILTVVLTFSGLLLFLFADVRKSPKIQVSKDFDSLSSEKKEIMVEIDGAVEKPGIYKFETGDRIEDLLIAAGGISSGADRIWMNKFLNRAAELSDGQKIYIPKLNEQSDVSSANKSRVYQNGSAPHSSTTEEKVNIFAADLKK